MHLRILLRVVGRSLIRVHYKGSEFYSKHVKEIVELFSTENEEKSFTVEQWNQAKKHHTFKSITANTVLQDTLL